MALGLWRGDGFAKLMAGELPAAGIYHGAHLPDAFRQIGVYCREDLLPHSASKLVGFASLNPPDGSYYVRYCFADPAHADAFRERLGGERRTSPPPPGRARR